MATITIQEIKEDMRINNDSDVFYYDGENKIGYHMHECSNGKCVFMMNTGKKISYISEEDFLEAVENKCYCASIGPDSYYTI